MPAKITKKKDGKYLLAVYMGRDWQGKQIVRCKTVEAKSDLDARRKYSEFESEVLKGKYTYDNKMKVAELCDIWLRDYVEVRLAPKTLASYKTQIKLRIKPGLGHVRLKDLRPVHIIQFMNELQSSRTRFDGKKKEQVSDRVISDVFKILSSMLTDAMEWQLIPENPCERVPHPKVKKSKAHLPPEEVIKAILAKVKELDVKHRLMIMLPIYTGIRVGEMLGLQWKDIDFEKKVISVVRSNQRVGKKLITKEPKTEGSVRRVSFGDGIGALLTEYKQWQDDERMLLGTQWQCEKEAWLFTKWNGLPMGVTTPTQFWRKFLKTNGFPRMRFHDLRHLSATILIAAGVPIKSVSARLGHTQISTTLDIYADALESVDRAAADQMDNYLLPEGSESQQNTTSKKLPQQ